MELRTEIEIAMERLKEEQESLQRKGLDAMVVDRNMVYVAEHRLQEALERAEEYLNYGAII